MKELSIAGKATRYEQAIKVAQRFYNNSVATIKKELEDIFPELKESDDEKIRKSLSAYFAKFKPNDMWDDNFSFGDILAWLEKQGNQDMGISEATKQVLEDNLNKALEKETPESLNEFLGGQGEQKPADEIGNYDHGKVLDSLMSAEIKTPEESLGIDSETYSEIIDECIYGEQKPAWSEEDEKLVKNLISTLSNLYARNLIEKETKEKYTNFLKSLRPQPKQEWNSKDKKIKNEIVNYFTCQCKDEPTRIKTLNRWICWLNALENSSVIKPMPEFDEWLKQIWDILDWAEEKGRITYSTWEDYTGWLSLLNPKNRWKPSDEQMDVLLSEVTTWTKGCPKQIVLESLYQDLQKLREK